MIDGIDRVYQSLLVLRCQTGDGDAFAQLVAAYQPRLRFFMRKQLPREESAEDLLQDVWFDVFRGIGRLSNPGAFTAWLYGIARHRAFRAWRQRRSFVDLDAVDIAAEENAVGPDAEPALQAINGLAPDHREVLLLRFMEGMSYEDIARVTRCPLGTVRSRLYYAKRALRSALERTPNRD